MKKILTLSFLLAFLCMKGWSQVSAYTFNQNAGGTYSAITGGTVLGNTSNDDEVFFNTTGATGSGTVSGTGFSLPFNFVYNGITYDHFAVNTNGFITLGTSTFSSISGAGASIAPLSSTSSGVQNAISAMSFDLQGQTLTSSGVRTSGSFTLTGITANRAAPGMTVTGNGIPANTYVTAVSGTTVTMSNAATSNGSSSTYMFGSTLQYKTAGSTLVIQWAGYRDYDASGDLFNFQIILAQTANSVQFVYGTNVASPGNNGSAYSAQVGLRGTSSNDFNNREVPATNGASWASSTAGNDNTDVARLRNTIVPGNGLTYTFTPTPSLSATALSAFNSQCINSTYGPNSFTITGTNLTTANVTVGTLNGYTYSTTSGGTYSTSLSIPQTGGSFSQTVYVKFTPTAAQPYSGNIAVGGGGASSITVAASGTGLNSPPSVSNTSVSVTSTTATINAALTSNGCSSVSAYGTEYSTVSGFANGAGTPAAGSALSGGNFTVSLTGLTPSTNYYYHVYATNSGSTAYSSQVAFTTSTPVLTVGTLADFGTQCINNTYGPNSFTVSGVNLTTANITVAALSGYTYSTTSGGTYTTTLSIPQTGGTFPSQTIYVKFTPTLAQSYNGNIVVGGGGAANKNVATTGSGINTPPTVAAGTATGVTLNSATVPGTISSSGCNSVTAYGVEYSTASGFGNGTGTQVTSSNLSGANFSVSLSGLTQSTTYYYHTYATNSGGTSYSAQGSFTTLSPTIATGTISGSPFCVTTSAGAAVSVPFTSAGTFAATNTYTAQLSSSSGSFGSPVAIGALVNSNVNSGSISATIPINTATGTGYRIRVVSNNPSVTGTDNGTNLAINLAANSIAPTATQNINVNTNGTALTVTEQSTAVSRVWYYGTVSGGPYNISAGVTTATYTPNFATQGTFYVVCKSTFACGTATSNQVQINVSATLTTGNISGSAFCAGSSVNVPFTSAGTFTANTYTAQLSGSGGSFASPVNIGSLISTNNSGTVNATIPANTTYGTGYRIRVVSSSPAVNGSDNGSNLTINEPPSIGSGGQPSNQTTCAGTSKTFTVTAAGTSPTYQWQYSADGSANWSNIADGTPVNITYSNAATATLTVSPNPGSASAIYYYRCVVSVANCSSQNSNAASLTVNALPVAAISYAGSPFCLNGGTASVTRTGQAGGTYSASPSGLSINSSTGTITLGSSNAGTYTVTYAFTNSSAGCSNSTTTSVTISSIPTSVSASATPNPICPGSMVSLTSLPDAAPVVVSQNFNSGPGSWTTINYSLGGTPANAAWTVRNDGYTYGGNTFHSNDNSRFILSNSDAQGSNQLFTWTQLISPSFSTVGLSTCSLSFYQDLPNDFFDLEAEVDISVDGGNNWTALHDYIDDGTIGSSSSFANSVLNLNSYIGYASVKIRFEFISYYGTWWGLDNINVTGGAIGAPFTYAWTSAPAGFTANTQNTTATVNTNTAYTVKVTNTFGCSATASTAVSVNTKPTAVISGTQTICAGSTAALNIAFTGTAPWTVQYNDGTNNYSVTTSSNPYTFTVSPATSITYKLGPSTVSDAICSGGNTSGQAAVTVSPLSAGGTVNSSATVCVTSNSGILNLTGNTGSVVQWEKSVDNGASWTTVSNTTTSLSYSGLTQTTKYRALVQSGVCSSAYSSVATITVSPVSAGGTVNSSTSVCSGSSGTLSLTGYTGTIVRWESSVNGGNTWTNIANTGTNQSYSNLVQTTQYRALVQSGACSSSYSSVAVVTVNPVTVGGTVNSDASVCSGSSGSLSLSGYAGSIVQWEKSTDGGTSWTAISNATASQGYSNLTQTTKYRVLVKSGTCPSSYSSVATITVKPIPAASISPVSDDACAGQSIAVNITGTAGASLHYAITPGTSGTVALPVPAFNSPTNTGTYTYSISSLSLNGCPGNISNNTATITIHALPDATISGYSYVQIGNQINLTGGTGGGTWSSNNTGAATIGASSGVVTGASSGTADIAYQVSNTYGNATCSSSAVKTIAITADYVTRNNGNFSNIATWKRGTVNGFVNATAIPLSVNTIEVQHDLILDQDFQAGANKSFVMSAAGTMTIQPGKIFSSLGSVDFGHKSVTVKSNAGGTGAIGQTTGTIANADNVTVERYTDAGSGITGRRAWRLVTSPVTDKTIHQAWQENSTWTSASSPAQVSNYGTLITGEGLTAQQAEAAGFDRVGGGNHTSIRQFTASADGGNWGALPGNSTTGTNISLSSQPAWMVFVRGDRTVNTTKGKGITTLRATGTLNQAAKTIAIDHTNTYVLVGNPYAAPINFDNIYNASISNTFVIWNSWQGDYGVYNFITKESDGSYTVVPFNSNAGSTDNNAKYIQSGSAFFVSPASTSTDGSITINEQSKNTTASGGISTFRETSAAVKKMWVNLNLANSDTSATVADGVLVKFNDNYAAGIDGDDAQKQWNFNENMDIRHSSNSLIIEARPDVVTTDTIHLELWNTVKRNYQLQVKTGNFASLPNLQAWLEDSYLGTKQPLSLAGDITTINFAVNSDSASRKSDRFGIVFQNNAVVLPVTITNLTAAPKDAGVGISWTAAHEVNIKGYTVQASRDGGKTYESIATAEAKNKADAALTIYQAFDSHTVTGSNLYRIRIEAQNGTVTYSNVVSVALGVPGTGIDIAVYPNPVREGKVHLQLSNLAAGNYLASVYSEGGQVVYRKKIVIGIANTVQSEELLIGKGLAQSSYQLRVSDHKGTAIKDVKLTIGK